MSNTKDQLIANLKTLPEDLGEWPARDGTLIDWECVSVIQDDEQVIAITGTHRLGISSLKFLASWLENEIRLISQP